VKSIRKASNQAENSHKDAYEARKRLKSESKQGFCLRCPNLCVSVRIRLSQYSAVAVAKVPAQGLAWHCCWSVLGFESYLSDYPAMSGSLSASGRRSRLREIAFCVLPDFCDFEF
jgi:hypothetical protein